jgi:hypothetical protein
MNIAFAFSGKAGKKGHESWGMSDEPGLSDRLYVRSKREDTGSSRLEIEIRKREGVAFTYYTFMKARNVAQSVSGDDLMKFEQHGRAGSFFAITLRIEGGYIPEVFAIYDIFENVFNQNIMGAVLTDVDTDGYLTYTISSFSDGDEALKKTERILKEQISSVKIDCLPDNLSTNRGKDTKIFGIKESLCTINNALFNDLEVIVARDYDTITNGPIVDPPTTPDAPIIVNPNSGTGVATSIDHEDNEKLRKAQQEIDSLRYQLTISKNKEAELLKLIEELKNGKQKKPSSELYKSVIVIAACIIFAFVLYNDFVQKKPENIEQIPSDKVHIVQNDSLKKAKKEPKENNDDVSENTHKWKVVTQRDPLKIYGIDGNKVGLIPKGSTFESTTDTTQTKIYIENKDSYRSYFTNKSVKGGYVSATYLELQQ